MMDKKRGALVVGASLAALTAGFYIRRWYVKRIHEEELESAELVQEFDEKMDAMNKPKRVKRSTNGTHKASSS
jgi:hypothetical protein